MDQKTVALQLRKLAADPENQTYIVREKGCMKGLLGFLDSPQQDVVLISLQSLEFLSAHPSNKEALSKEPGLLAKLVGFSEHPDERVQKVAKSVLENLENYINGENEESKRAAAVASATKRANNASFSQSAGSSASASASAAKPAKPVLYSVPLKVAQLNTVLQRARLERALLAVKGVVSVTVELYQTQVTVYTRNQDQEFIERLLEAAQRVGMAAEAGQCEEEEQEEDKNRGNQSAPSYVNAPAKEAAPGPSYASAPRYLQPVDLTAARQGSVVEYGMRFNSLEERQRRAKKQEEERLQKQGTVRNLITSVTSYFW